MNAIAGGSGSNVQLDISGCAQTPCDVSIGDEITISASFVSGMFWGGKFILEVSAIREAMFTPNIKRQSLDKLKWKMLDFKVPLQQPNISAHSLANITSYIIGTQKLQTIPEN